MTELRYLEGAYTGKNFLPGVEFSFQAAIPSVECGSFALHVECDGPLAANISALLRLAEEGKAPWCICLGVHPGQLSVPGGKRQMRMNNYDQFDREYSDFLIYELIPHLETEYGLRLDPSPDLHAVSGGSSGALAAFAAAWFHPEYFRRVYLSSPSFLSLGRGSEVPYLIRKYETKPLRIYEESSENEPNDYYGWSRPIDEEAREAFTYANYDFRSVFFPGEGHCSRYGDEGEACRRSEWLWQDWQTRPIVPVKNSPKVDTVIPFGSRWELCEIFPQGKNDPPAALRGGYESIVLSNDGAVWYAADKTEPSVFLHVNDSSLSPARRLLHASLHTSPGRGVWGPSALR